MTEEASSLATTVVQVAAYAAAIAILAALFFTLGAARHLRGAKHLPVLAAALAAHGAALPPLAVSC